MDVDIKEKRELFDMVCGADILSSAMTVSECWDPSGFGLISRESGESHFAFCCLYKTWQTQTLEGDL